MKRLPFVILGAGGHGRVVAEAIRSSGGAVEAFLDADPALRGRSIDGIPVTGGDDRIGDYAPEHYAFALGVGGLKSTRARQAVYASREGAGRRFPPVVAASALVSGSVTLADAAQVLTRAVVHPGASLGLGVVANTGSIIEHDCIVADHAFVGPGAVLCGGVSLGRGAFVGAGAIVLPGVRIGAGALVPAGAVVRREVEEGSTATCRRR